MSYKIEERKHEKIPLNETDYEHALDQIFSLIQQDKNRLTQIKAIGHRIVHGGEYFDKATIITPEVLKKINKCRSLAPLHNPASILGIEKGIKSFSKLPHIAVFDTAFHQSMPKHAYLYALPYELYEKHQVRRYGFHGTSHHYVAEKAADALNKPFKMCSFITAHLGNGCSLAAISNGKSIDTSMGLTPLEGLVMGTRSGDVDPALHLYLAESLNIDLEKITDILNKKSGLLGISGISMDLRILEAAAKKGEERAKLAIEIFVYRLAKYIGAYMTVLNRIDAIVFTGGIGENSILIREKVIKRLSLFQFKLDEEKNKKHGDEKGVITKSNTPVAMVIKTNEELMIARSALKLAGGDKK